MHVSETQTLIQSSKQKRHELGQFFTPPPVAEFMASLFAGQWHELDLLDAGAGAGILSSALVKRLCASDRRPGKITITAYEFDETVIESLHATFRDCQRACESVDIQFSAKVLNDDFIAAVAPTIRDDLFAPRLPRFNAAIVNPPYRKIRGDSATRLLLRSVGIETGNLYTGFVALTTKLLTDRGELVAITPRSFCNGPYFKPFRTDFLKTMSLRQLHIFESRSAAFNHDNVLQENIIFHAVKDTSKPKRIIISSSSGTPGSLISEREVDYHKVVSPADPQQFIHFVEGEEQDTARAAMGQFQASLSDLGLSVSTGRVVDFRAKEFLRSQPSDNTAPLIYPYHLNGGFVDWPKEQARKPNAIENNARTHELLVPAGVYILVKRFTTKEERRRIVACIYDSQQIHAPFVGFENHLNYFHANGNGLPMSLAKGLTAFLNSTVVDVYFRQFNGHTQVNATDLRSFKYPTRVALENLGQKITNLDMRQDSLDALVQEAVF